MYIYIYIYIYIRGDAARDETSGASPCGGKTPGYTRETRPYILKPLHHPPLHGRAV